MSDRGTFKYKGIPIMAHIGSVFGDTFFVDYRNGSDGNSGKEPDKAVKTLSRAYALCTSNNNDAIFIDGDQTVTETAMIDWSKNRIHVYGCNGIPPGAGYGAGAKVSMGVTTATSDLTTVKVTGVRNTFNGVKFMNSNTLTQNMYGHIEAGEYNRYNQCEFYYSAKVTTDLTADLLMNGDSSQFYGCTFGTIADPEHGASGKERPCVLLTRETVSGKVCRDGWFEECRFLRNAAHVDVCHVYGPNANDVERSLVFKNCVFWNSVLATATIADAVNFGAAQTVGEVLIINSHCMNCTAIAGANLNIYYGSNTAQTTDGIAEEIAA